MNTQLEKFYTFEDDAFTHNWSNENLWINPPWPYISEVIQKIIHDQAIATIITPYDEKSSQKKWIKSLRQLSIARPIRLPHTNDLFLPLRTNNTLGIGKPHWHSTIAWRISGKFIPGLTGSFANSSYKDNLPINLEEINFAPIQLMTLTVSYVENSNGPDLPDTTGQVQSTESKQISLNQLFPNLEIKPEPTLGEKKTLLSGTHLKGHFGASSTYKTLYYAGYNWKGMQRDCQDECLHCGECQKFTIGKNGYHPIKPIAAALPFDHVAIDLAGPFLQSEKSGHTMLLLLVDVCTRFVFLRTLPDKTAASVAQALFKIFCDMGFPTIIQSDNGKEFVNNILKGIKKISNIDHRLITPYHPRANGLAERNIQTAKQSIFKLLKGREQDWELYVPQTQFFMNTKVAAYHNSTPYSLLFGKKHNLFEDFTSNEDTILNENQLMEKLELMTQIVYPSISKKSSLFAKKMNPSGENLSPKLFPSGCFVMSFDELKSTKAQPTYLGPFKVIRRNMGGAYQLLDTAGNTFTRAPENLKLVKCSKEFGTSLNVKKILNHRGTRSEREYLV